MIQQCHHHHHDLVLLVEENGGDDVANTLLHHRLEVCGGQGLGSFRRGGLVVMVVTMTMMMVLMTMMMMTIMFMMKNLILLQKCEVTKLMKLFIRPALHEQTEMILNIVLVIFVTSSGGKRALKMCCISLQGYFVLQSRRANLGNAKKLIYRFYFPQKMLCWK